MPFLRAALLKKKAKTEPDFEAEQEEELTLSPLVVPVEITEEPEELQEQEQAEEISIANLQKIIDEKVEQQIEIEEEEPAAEEPEEEEHQEKTEEIIGETAEAVEPVEPVEVETEEPEAEPEIEEPEEQQEEIQEIIEEVKETETETEIHEEPEEPAEPEEFKLMYDVTSGERYVDKVSTKTEFDKMLDELGNISKDLLSWEVEKFAKKYTGKFQGDFEKSEADAKKYEAFLGGYITNAAMILYDNGYKDAAIKKLEQSKSVLEARKKLEDETLAIKSRVEEEDASVDLSDILGLFGDG